MDLIKAVTEPQMKEIPALAIGDTVCVNSKIKEGNRERIQSFEGTLIARKHGGMSESITVRRVSYGIGVEKVFPLQSPNIASIDVKKHGKIRRAKLYYLRGKVGKYARVRQDI